jgi:hypothetical protein
MKEESRNEIVSSLCEIISKSQVQNNQEDLVEVISHFLFSIGSSLERVELGSAEDVILRYAKDPTLGNVLMAQAYHMKETWTDTERYQNNATDTGIVQGQTEEK